MENAQILGESIKDGLALKLTEAFEGVTVYKEFIPNPVFPHFFIYQLTLNSREHRQGVLRLSYLMNLRYRHAADLKLVYDLNERLDNTSLKLMEFDYIKTANWLIPIRPPIYTEKTDSVLQYFCNFELQATKEKIEETCIKMQSLDANLNLKGDG